MKTPYSRPRRHSWLWPASNTVSRGTPGGGLQRQITAPVPYVLAGAAAITMIATASGHPLTGLAVAALLLWAAQRAYAPATRRYRAGQAGEVAAARALRRIPDAAIYHDVLLGKENADHVVVTRQGVFCVEVKHWAQVQATPRGITSRGQPRDRVLPQAHRQAAKLRAALGVPVTPIVVFTVPGSRVHVRHLDRVPVTTLAGLPATLTRLRRTSSTPLTRAQFTTVLSRLDTLTQETP